MFEAIASPLGTLRIFRVKSAKISSDDRESLGFGSSLRAAASKVREGFFFSFTFDKVVTRLAHHKIAACR